MSPFSIRAQAAAAAALAAAMVLGPACQAEPLPQRLGLAEAWQLALRNDATLRAAEASAASQRERIVQARSQLLPSVTATASRTRNNLDTTSTGSTGQATTTNRRYYSGSQVLALRQPLYRPVALAGLRQAQAQVAQSEATLEKERQDLAVRVASAYLQVLGADDQLRLVQHQRTVLDAQVASAQRLFAAGPGTRTDIDEAMARRDMAVAQELEARQAAAYAREQLRLMLGLEQPVAAVAPLDPQRMPLAPLVPDQAAHWTARAEASSPEIRAAQAAVEAARREIDKAKASHQPTLDGTVQVTSSDSDSVTSVGTRYENRTIGLQLSVPIYSGGLTSSQVRQAAAELVRQQENLEALRRDLAMRVYTEFRGVGEGVVRVRALEQAVRSAQAVVDSTRKSFQAGARTQLDILDAEDSLASATRNLGEARFNYLLARIRLLALAGEADTAAIAEADGWLQR